MRRLSQDKVVQDAGAGVVKSPLVLEWDVRADLAAHVSIGKCGDARNASVTAISRNMRRARPKTSRRNGNAETMPGSAGFLAEVF